ncbi:DUF4233 domain-containing protein [Micromonospora yasonensis]|uniref:DUF4233 domain-containing protein n=1 Tax=Micromonospora yasonensis TaxID=1128667 RepID=UPI0022327921|nr:DUF4233 domain-containing protein [Micromonospora yasonensis]MCW3844962.1 DUF4233 domain-containing protein [Micromonospora yasonensis]
MSGPAEQRPDAAEVSGAVDPTGPADRPDAADRPAGGPAGAPRTGPEGPAGPGERRSGLRNPERAVRGLGAGSLALEALVLLLAIQPIRLVGGHLSGAAIGAIVALAVACVLLAGQMKRPWAWHAGTVLQGLLLLSGLLHWSLFVLGVMFGLVWAYALHVRRVILG